MAKSKHAKDEEFFRGKIRELEALVKALKRRIRQLEKQQHLYDNKDDEIEEKAPSRQIDWCPMCSKAEVEEFTVANRIFKRCNLCGYRSKPLDKK